MIKRKKILFCFFVPVLLSAFISIPAFTKINGSINSRQYSTPEYNREAPDTNVIDMGMCMQGDTIATEFELKNAEDTLISINRQNPSFYLGQTPKATKDFEVLWDNLPVQRIISKGITETIRIEYRTENTLRDSISKDKEALLKLGLYFQDTCDGTEQSDMITSKFYKLRFRKTDKVLDGFENRKVLDYVYINPMDSLPYNWIVQNSSIRGLSVEKQEMKWLSPRQSDAPTEFYFSPVFYSPLVNYPPNQKFARNTWSIYYSPKDTVRDVIELSLQYKPDPLLHPDSIDFVKDTIIGVGVVQKLRIEPGKSMYIDSIYQGSLDGKEVTVLDLGKVVRDSNGDFTKYANIFVVNDGNIPFRAVDSVQLLREQGIGRSEYFSQYYKDTFFDITVNPTESAYYYFKFQAHESGQYKARLVINSDIYKRNIWGFPQDAREIVYLLKAECIEPEIKLNTSNVDFQNVVISTDCPKKITDSISIENKGDAPLDITNLWIAPYDSPYEIEPDNIEIKPGEKKKLYVRIDTDGLEIDAEYNAELIIASNAYKPYDTLRVNLTAKTVKASITKMMMSRDVKAPPGRTVSFPILVDGKKIQIARTYKDTLTFEKTLLAYHSFENISTASAEATDITLSEYVDGRLAIDLQMPGNKYFSARDTLIIIRFSTYLGSKISTELALLNPELGDGICNKVLTTVNSNGLFTLDSVCGLEYKAVPTVIKNFSLMSIYPNPADENFSVKYNIREQTNCTLNIYDLYGQKVFTDAGENLIPGDYETRVASSGLMQGIYYLEITDGYFYDIFKIVVTR